MLKNKNSIIRNFYNILIQIQQGIQAKHGPLSNNRWRLKSSIRQPDSQISLYRIQMLPGVLRYSHPGEEVGDTLVDSEIAGSDDGGAGYDAEPEEQGTGFGALHELGHVYEGHLQQDEAQEDGPHDAEDHGQQELMQNCAEKEGDHLGLVLAELEPDDHLQVDVAVEELVHGLVPFPVELLVGGGVPPVLIELPVVQLGDLGEHVRDVLEGDVEHQQDQDGARQHYAQGQLQVRDLEPQLHGRLDVLGVDDVGGQHAPQRRHALSHDVQVVDAALPGVHVVHQPWSPHEKHEVSQSHIVRVGAHGGAPFLEGGLAFLAVISVDGRVGVHLHEVGAGLQDDEGSVGGAPVFGEDQHRREQKQTGLSCVLKERGKYRGNAQDDELLQEEGSEGPEEEHGPDQDAQEVVLLESVVEVGLQKLAVLQLVEQGLGEQEHDRKDDHHVEEPFEMASVQLRLGVLHVQDRGSCLVWGLAPAGRGQVGVLPSSHQYLNIDNFTITKTKHLWVFALILQQVQAPLNTRGTSNNLLASVGWGI